MRYVDHFSDGGLVDAQYLVLQMTYFKRTIIYSHERYTKYDLSKFQCQGT
jgi:hypothetical protein